MSREEGERPNAHRRMRSLLRNYYGIAEEQKPQNQDPMSLDSPNFAKEKFIQKQLRTKKLSALVSVEVKLKKECHSLDSEMKTLVYENYNKFISATDTIQQMKAHIVDMDEKMKELQSKITSISKSSKEINEKFAENRSAIEKYSGISSLLKKRQFLFELPSRLHKCIEMKAYAQAVKYYNKSKEILDKYKHLPSFDSIDKESVQIIEDLKVIIQDKMIQSSTSPKTVTECTSLLLELGQDAKQLRENFLKWREEDLQKLLEGYCSEPLPELPEKTKENENMKETKAEEAAFGLPDELSSQLDPIEEEPMEEILSEEEIHFRRTALYLEFLNNAFLREILDFGHSYGDLFILRAAESDRELLQEKFDETMFPIFSNFTTLVTEHLISQKESTYVLQCLELMGDRFGKVSSELSSGIDLSLRVQNILSNTIKSFMRHQFEQCIESIDGKLSVLQRFAPIRSDEKPKTPPNVAVQCDLLANEMKVDIDNFLSSTAIFIVSGDRKNFLARHGMNVWDMLNDFVIKIADSFNEQAAKFIKQQIDSRRKKKTKEPPVPPIFLCMFSRLLSEFEKTTIPHLDDQLVTIGASLKNNITQKKSHLVRAFDTEALTNKIGGTAQNLLKHFVRDQGTHISLMLRKGIETPDWSLMKEPRDVRLAIELVVKEFHLILGQVEQIFPLLEKEQSIESESYSSLSRYRVLSAFDESSRKRAALLDSIVEMNANSVLTGIAKIGLKSFVECVRLCTFNQFGYQQMQVDVAFTRAVWKQLDFDTEKSTDRMLDDVIESTTWRCFELNPMGSKIIESICEQKLAKYNSSQAANTTQDQK